MLCLAVTVDWLRPGELGTSDVPSRVWHLAERGGWEPRGGHRLFVQHHDCVGKSELSTFIANRVADLPVETGKLIVSIQSTYALRIVRDEAGNTILEPDETLVYHTGLAFVPSDENPPTYEGGPDELTARILTLFDEGRESQHPWVLAANEGRREDRAKSDARDKRHNDAESRAECLLLEMLNEEQTAEYHERGSFRVRSPDGTVYRVEKNHAGNVYRIENGIRVARLCAHPPDYLPVYDVMLMQKIMLESEPALFLGIANDHSEWFKPIADDKQDTQAWHINMDYLLRTMRDRT